MKANDLHYFSNLFDKVLYMFRTGPLSIIRSKKLCTGGINSSTNFNAQFLFTNSMYVTLLSSLCLEGEWAVSDSPLSL